MSIEVNLTSQSRKLSFNLCDCGTNEQPETSPSSLKQVQGVQTPAITSSPGALGHRLRSPRHHPLQPRLRAISAAPLVENGDAEPACVEVATVIKRTQT